MSYARFVRGLTPYFVSVSLLACLERPIGTTQPRTTNVLTDELVNSAVTKIDLLFVVDNSASMADKQALLAEALPDLVRGLVDPPCLTRAGENLGRPAHGECPAGSSRQIRSRRRHSRRRDHEQPRGLRLRRRLRGHERTAQ